MIDLHKLDKFRLKDREREFYGCTGDSGNGVFKMQESAQHQYMTHGEERKQRGEQWINEKSNSM